MTRCHFLCALLCFFFIGCTQPEKQTRSQQIEKIAELQKLAKTRINDSSLIRLNLASELINSLEDLSDSLFIENIFLKGYYFSRRNKTDSAYIYLHKAFSLIDSSNTSARDLTYFRYASSIDFKNGKYVNAISKGNAYLKVLNPNKHHNKKVYAYSLLEKVYIQLKDYKQALYYNKKCIEASEKAKNVGMYAVSQISRAKYLYNYFNDADNAYKLLDSVIQSKRDLSVNSKLQLQYELGNLKFRDKLFKDAIQNYENTLAYINNSKQDSIYSEMRSKCFINISEANTYLKNKPYAIKYLDSASKLVYEKKFNALYVDLAKQHLRIKNIDFGYNIDASLADIDSIESNNNREYTNRMNEELLALKSSNEREKILTTQKQEGEINNLKLKSRNLMLIVLAISILLIGYIIYRQRKFKFEKQSLQMQQRLLRSQMNPHFMSNTLYAIQNTIKKDQEGSVNYLTKFSRLLRLILENSLQNYVALEKEIESLKKYMDLQLLRFPDKFDYSINLNDVDGEIIVIPPMLLQPFIENSIEHGFFGIDYKGNIKMMLSHSKKYLSCVIEDNGIGLKSRDNSSKQSVSLELISDFILKATKTKISIVNKKSVNDQESGTRIEFLIPYKILEND